PAPGPRTAPPPPDLSSPSAAPPAATRTARSPAAPPRHPPRPRHPIASTHRIDPTASTPPHDPLSAGRRGAAGPGASRRHMEALLSQLPIGLSIAAVLLLAALGLTFTFGQMGVINMAHGEFIMVGAYTAYALQDWAGRQAVAVALPVAFLVAGAMGLVLERAAIRRFYGRPLDTLLLTWGISLLLQQLARDVFGAPNVQVLAPGWLSGGLRMFGSQVPYTRLFILALAALSVAAIWVYQNRTLQGRRMRAVMQNRQLAACSGVDTGRVDRTTFFIGSGLAGVAGIALTLIGPIGPNLGTYY